MALHENNPYLVSIDGQNHIESAVGKSNYLVVEPNNKYLQSNKQRTPENNLESESNQNGESLNKNKATLNDRASIKNKVKNAKQSYMTRNKVM